MRSTDASDPPAEQRELAALAAPYVPDVDDLADPAVPTDIWEQDVPQSGAGVDGSQPRRALAVAVVGISATREVPSLAGAAARIPCAANEVFRIVGRTPQRRRVTISGTVPLIVALSQEQAQALQGLDLNPPVTGPVPITYAGELWAVAGAAGFVSFLSELDLG